MQKSISAFMGIGLVVLGVPALAVLMAPNLLVIAYLALILPGIILSFTPTAFLYFATVAVCWFAFHRVNMMLALGIGLAAAWGLGVSVPAVLNQQTASQVERLARQNAEGSIPSAQTIALDLSEGSATTDCADLCLMLLYNRDAERVIVIPPKSAPPVAYRLEDRATCSFDHDKYGQLRRGGQSRWFQQNQLAEDTGLAAVLRMAAGECLVRETAASSNADLTLRRLHSPRSTGQRVTYDGYEIIQSGRPVARQVAIQARYLRTPLTLEPYGPTYSFTGWNWAMKSVDSKPIDLSSFLARHTGFRLDPPKADARSLAPQIDRLLADPAAPPTDIRFQLLPTYFDGIYDDPNAADGQRVARLLRDPRFLEFSRLSPKALAVDEFRQPVQDAILDRLTSQATDDKTIHVHYRVLDEQIAKFPAGAFRLPDPRIDALLANPAARPYSANLVRRLTERGPAASAALMRILEQSLEPGRWSAASNAAVLGLCELGPAAAQHRPQLGSWLENKRIPGLIPNDTPWRAMLVSLGANVDELQPPVKSGRENILRAAREGCAKMRVR